MTEKLAELNLIRGILESVENLRAIASVVTDEQCAELHRIRLMLETMLRVATMGQPFWADDCEGKDGG